MYKCKQVKPNSGRQKPQYIIVTALYQNLSMVTGLPGTFIVGGCAFKIPLDNVQIKNFSTNSQKKVSSSS